MKVTVLITNYNYENYLEAALHSVLNQTYKNFEILVVDDGSTDQSKTILDQLKQEFSENLFVFYKENGGQASAFNLGIEKASGDIIAFLDADDYWYPEKLERIVEEHLNGKQIVQHGLKVNDQLTLALLSSGNARIQKELTFAHGFPGVIPTSGMSILKKCCDKVFPVPENIRLNADLYVRWVASYYFSWGTIEEQLGCYRVHGKNGWFSNQNMEIAYTIVLEIKNKYGIEIPYYEFSYRDTCIELFKRQIVQGQNYVVYGTGDLGIKTSEMVAENHANVNYFADSNVSKAGNRIKLIPIISRAELKERKTEYNKIIIASVYAPEIVEALLKDGFLEKDIITVRF